MLTTVLLQADADPTVSVGGMLPSIGGNIRIGKSGCFITEACEYTNSFLSFFPTVAVILNIDADHLDFFKDIDDIRKSFAAFANLLPDNGLLVINSDIERYEEITKDGDRNISMEIHYNFRPTDESKTYNLSDMAAANSVAKAM